MTRSDAVRRAGVVALGSNLLLLLIKGAVLLLIGGGLALNSEATNSAIDSVHSTIVLIGLYYSTKPADFDHPHGHERIEPFVSLFVAAGAFILGGSLLIGAVQALVSGAALPETSVWGLAVLLITVIMKYGVYRYLIKIGDEQHSPAARAIALDSRNDILTAVAAFTGVAASVAGFPLFDPVGSAIVSLGIIYTGYEIASENIRYLVGSAPSEDLQDDIKQQALAVNNVHGVHDIVPHYVGPEVDVSLHIEVPSGMTLREAHEIETEVIANIKKLDEVDDVYVHVDPEELDEWKSN